MRSNRTLSLALTILLGHATGVWAYYPTGWYYWSRATPTSAWYAASTPTRTPTPTPTPVIPADAFQLRYAANLNAGESWIDLTNTGVQGGDDPAGNICANIYAFSPDEQMISCCSCLVTPNALANLGVNRDLTSRTLTGVIPTSVVVKILASKPPGNGTSCPNSASAVTASDLVSGLRAWGTTLHSLPAAGSYAVTETPFSPAFLSASELERLSSFCGFIVEDGSGFGICSSCRAGGL